MLINFGIVLSFLVFCLCIFLDSYKCSFCMCFYIGWEMYILDVCICFYLCERKILMLNVYL